MTLTPSRSCAWLRRRSRGSYPAVLPTASQHGSQAPYWGMAPGYHKSTTRRALPSGRSSAFQPSLRPKVSSRWLKLTRSRAPRYGTRSPSAIRVSFGSTQGRSARITTWSLSMCDSTGNARGRIADRHLACRHWSNTSSKSRWNCPSSRNGLPARGFLSRRFEPRRLQQVPAGQRERSTMRELNPLR